MLNKHDLFERRVRAAVRESRKLEAHRYTIVKLSEPIQQGWRRFHVLTDHARRRRDAETLEAILNLIGTERESRRPDFRVKQRRMKRLIEVGQPLSRISEWEWNRESVPLDWLRYFHVYRYWQWGRRTFRLEFAQPYLFELRVEPRWIWEFREVDPDLETRIAELDRWMERTRAWSHWWSLKGRAGRWFYPDERRRALAREHRRDIRNAMKGEVDLWSSMRRLQLSLLVERCVMLRQNERGVRKEQMSTRTVAGALSNRPINLAC
jgi:hypothetical protein